MKLFDAAIAERSDSSLRKHPLKLLECQFVVVFHNLYLLCCLTTPREYHSQKEIQALFLIILGDFYIDKVGFFCQNIVNIIKYKNF